MDLQRLTTRHQTEVTELFTAVFTASDGAEEGKIVGQLSSELCAKVDNRRIVGLGAFQGAQLVGGLFLTPLDFKEDTTVFMVAPVAVQTTHQRQGIGQALLRDALATLKTEGVDVAVTYGDPAYYQKSGFKPLNERTVPAPYPLSLPHGWLGQSLSEQSIPALQSRPTCVPAFHNPALW